MKFIFSLESWYRKVVLELILDTGNALKNDDLKVYTYLNKFINNNNKNKKIK